MSGALSAAISKALSGRIAIASGVMLSMVLSLAAISQVRAAQWWEKEFWMSGPRYDRIMPACDYPRALDRIISQFHTKEYGFWNSELRIVGVEDIKETAVMPWAAQSIPRRFCSSTVVINDGARHPMYYSIAEDTGMIGMDWGVNWCVVGLDRDWAYNPQCRSARP
ncbi:MAG: hypothetical protein WBQ55_01525 [Xanthobacteraceae bacterium]|jgi:hypothetical protein